MGEFSLTHIIIVGIIFLVFFGPKRLPQLGSSLGEAIRGFKNAMGGENGLSGDQAPQAPTPPQQQIPQQNQNALRDAPAQHTSDVQNAQYTEDKNRGGHS